MATAIRTVVVAVAVVGVAAVVGVVGAAGVVGLAAVVGAAAVAGVAGVRRVGPPSVGPLAAGSAPSPGWPAAGLRSKRSGRCASGWQRAADPGPPWMPRARAAHAPTSTRIPARPPAVTTGLHVLPSASEPGGHASGRSHVRPERPSAGASGRAAAARVPRGQAASGATHAAWPATTMATAGEPQRIEPPRGSDPRAAHAPETTSSDWPAPHDRKTHPAAPEGARSPSMRAAGPQNASATGSGTHAPS